MSSDEPMEGALCMRCGVLALDAGLHHEWHVKLDEAIAAAARTATNPPSRRRT